MPLEFHDIYYSIFFASSFEITTLPLVQGVISLRQWAAIQDPDLISHVLALHSDRASLYAI